MTSRRSWPASSPTATSASRRALRTSTAAARSYGRSTSGSSPTVAASAGPLHRHRRRACLRARVQRRALGPDRAAARGRPRGLRARRQRQARRGPHLRRRRPAAGLAARPRAPAWPGAARGSVRFLPPTLEHGLAVDGAGVGRQPLLVGDGRRASRCWRAKLDDDVVAGRRRRGCRCPGPPISTSSPAPPSRVSLPAPPMRTSSPSPPSSVSSAEPAASAGGVDHVVAGRAR